MVIKQEIGASQHRTLIWLFVPIASVKSTARVKVRATQATLWNDEAQELNWY